MKKIILSIMMVMLCFINTAAIERTKDIGFSSFSAWTPSSWDSNTNTLTIGKAWGGGSVWLSSYDATGYEKVVLKLSEASTQKVALTVQYTDSYDDNGTTKYYQTQSYIEVGATETSVSLEKYSIRAIQIACYSSTYEGVTIKPSELYLYHKDNKVETATTIYEGEVATESWAGYAKITDVSAFESAQAGDMVRVHVTAFETSAQIHLQHANWEAFSPALSCSIKSTDTAPMTVDFVLTEDNIKTINGNGGTDSNGNQIGKGLIVKGCYFTFNKVELLRYIEVSSDVEKGNAVTNVWTGDATISWATGSSHSELIDKSKFTELKAGDKVRTTFASMKLGAQGKILHGWTSWDTSIVPIKKLPSECGDYFEYTVTEDMVTDIQTDGLRVSGIGYNLISVDIIDPDKEYTVVADFDKNDIKAWEPEEAPNLTFTLQSIEANEITVPIVVTLSTDTYEDFKTYTENVTLASGEKKTVDVNLTDLEPGFYRMTAKANNNTVCTYYIGYNPTAIGCENDAQPDFWTFWDKEKRKLAKIGIDATLTELADKSTDSRKVYEVKMQSVPDAEGESNVYIYGYYAEPTGEGSYPCLVRFQGTDSGSGTPKAMGGDDNPGWSELIISTRGQMLSRVKDNDEFIKFIPDGKTAADFYAYGLGDNDKHYYRAAYLDCKRAIDFVAAREKVNKDQIFAAGGSQGGCFTYVAAALDDRIRAIAPSITGHADFPHTMEIVSWPTSIFNKWITENSGDDKTYATAEEAKVALLKHLSYFDTKNFASRITCPVITNFSLQDQTDGPHLNISPYNLLTNVAAEDKAYSINPFKGHAAADNWETTFKEFFNNYMSSPATKSYFLSVGETGYSTVYLPFDALVPDGVKIYTVSSISGDKVQLTSHTAESGNLLLLPAKTAVVVNAAEGDYQFVANSTGISTTSVSGTNYLSGVTERTAVSSLESNGTIYALGSGAENKLGFYKVSSGSYIPANKAYLSVATSSPLSLSKAFYISSPTGITNVGNDGQKDGTPVYSINGIKSVNGNKYGILVKKGKKTMNK